MVNGPMSNRPIKTATHTPIKIKFIIDRVFIPMTMVSESLAIVSGPLVAGELRKGS